jgi:predicted DNA-binding transcriptional regulator AlpA
MSNATTISVRKLPVFVRFRDLAEAGIAKNWQTLSRLIDEDGFPQGRLLSPNIRAWVLDEVEAWLESRPTERKPVPQRWARCRAAADRAGEGSPIEARERDAT